MPVGFLLLASKRYVKKHWSLMHFAHAVMGFVVLAVTLTWAFKILDYFEWKVNTDIHSLAGMTTLIMTSIVALSGSTTAGLMQFYNSEKPWTAKEKVTRIGKCHRYGGYLMLFIGNATAMSGIGHYYKDIVMDESKVPLSYISMLTFSLLVFLFECCHRSKDKKAKMTVETPNVSHDKTGRLNIYSGE